MKTFQLKAGKNQFRCYHCRNIFSQKDGNWFDWDQIQVHLCRTCDKITETKPQRLHKR